MKTIPRSMVQNREPRNKLTYISTEKLRTYKGERTVSSIGGIGKLESYMQKKEDHYLTQAQKLTLTQNGLQT